jgi:hypothetical protein
VLFTNFFVSLHICFALLWLSLAQAEIYRCTDAEGNAVFSQTPCVEDEAEPAEEEVIVAEDPAVSTTDSNAERRDEEEVTQCKKPYRDAIDEIEAEMQEGYSAEQGEVFKNRLRGLTKQLRRCEA